jgi:hypothetical protein
MPADDYEDLKSQYHAATRAADGADRVAQLERLTHRLREFCIANGGDLKELDVWLANELDDWAGYAAG